MDLRLYTAVYYAGTDFEQEEEHALFSSAECLGEHDCA